MIMNSYELKYLIGTLEWNNNVISASEHQVESR
jgi:hypothetical protein